MIHAMLPLKHLARAKGRLGSVLSVQRRRELVLAMLEDLLMLLVEHDRISSVSVLADDLSYRDMTKRLGGEFLADPTSGNAGLNGAVEAALGSNFQQLEAGENGGTSLCRATSSDHILLLHADLPALSAEDVDSLLSAIDFSDNSLVIAPDRHRHGTNALLFPAGQHPHFQFGQGSFQRHRASAAAAGRSVQIVEASGLGFDLDTPADFCFLASKNIHLPTGLAVSVVLDRHAKAEVSAQASDGTKKRPDWHQAANAGSRLGDEQALKLAEVNDLQALMKAASALRDQGYGNVVTYSRKVFLPLTRLCRDVCHYCTFAKTPRQLAKPYMDIETVLETCRRGAAMGCKEALFTLGEKPEARYSAARDALAELGFSSTLAYVEYAARRVLEETGLLPHINAGCMDASDFERLRCVAPSMGLMLESASARLCEKGMPHFGSPDKDPIVRMATINRAGEARVPFTSGILIGIGETRQERIEALLLLHESHERFGHLQEIIIQNFRAKPDTKMAQAQEPDLDDLCWTLAVARLIFGAEMSIQTPPNLSPLAHRQLLNSGLNDWGGISPLTPDYVNPEAPWPEVDYLAGQAEQAGKWLTERLTIYPAYAINPQRWLAPALRQRVAEKVDSRGMPRMDNWVAGSRTQPPENVLKLALREVRSDTVSQAIQDIIAKAGQQDGLTESDITQLFRVEGEELAYVCQAADQLRKQTNGDTVTYAVNRNINYTNICYFKCQFCAFSKGKLSENLRGKPYDLSHEEIARRCLEAWARGATEVCMQGGIHPRYTGQTYLEILHTVKDAVPEMHVHAFSPLEVWQGARTLGVDVRSFLTQLKRAGLSSLPGTAAEILDDEVRALICPDKINTAQWLGVVREAHELGLPTTATMMFGHVERPEHWARHLLRIRSLQESTGGITEFVPLPFVPSEAPMFLKGRARPGPTFRETLLVHAVARLALHGQIDNIQASWVKLGTQGVAACLKAGANDVGGTLMNESISRAAGASHGQEWSVGELESTINGLGRRPQQRTTLYGSVSAERKQSAQTARPLEAIVNTAPWRAGLPSRQELIRNPEPSKQAAVVNIEPT